MRRTRHLVRAAVLIGVAIGSQAAVTRAADGPVELRAGAASADITPDVRMLNWNTLRPYGEVRDPVFARAVVLADGRTRIAFIVCDLLDVREFAVARVRRAVAQGTGIPESHVILHATHTHSGPKSEMGPEPVLPKEQTKSRPAQQNLVYRAWATRFVGTCVELVRKADASLVPVTLWLGRGHVGEWLFNRRPVKPDGTVQSMLLPPDPHALSGGLKFGPVDPTVTVIALRDTGGGAVATFFHLTAHAVAVYGAFPGVSADWPGAAVGPLREALGGEPIFLQGCAGDIVPARRGIAAAVAMGKGIAGRVLAANQRAAQLPAGALRTSSAIVGLPTTADAAVTMKRATLDAEVQVVTCGPLAIVTLPGEPLLELGTEIQARSPFPHTIVLGYANGRGVGYVGLPGGKVKGGYEMTDVGAGADEAGRQLVETAVRLLAGHAAGAR